MARSTDMVPLLVVLTGPSGVGKDAVFSRMRELGRSYHFAVTATTRPKRDREVDGDDYIFLSEAQLREMIDHEELIEWAEVYGNLYGVPKTQVRDALREGNDVIVKTDVQGVRNIRKVAPDALFIFIAPPNTEELARRLSLRMTETAQALKVRLRTAEEELKEAAGYEHVVVNHSGRLGETVQEIESIIERERRRQPPRRIDL